MQMIGYGRPGRPRRPGRAAAVLTIVLSQFALASGALGAAGVELDGTLVPKDKLVVYLFIGQSNMAGRDGDRDTTTHDRCWSYNVPNTSDTSYHWKKAQAMIHPDIVTGRGGPGMPFLKKLASYYPDYYIGIVQNAHSARYVRRQGSDDHYEKGDKYYDEIIDAANAIKANVTLGGIVCMLGYMDANNDWESQNYQSNLLQMAADMRADLGDANLPFIVGRFEVNASNRPTYWTRIRDQIDGLDTTAYRNQYIDVIPYTPSASEYVDDHHYNRAGYLAFSESAATLIKDNGWFPLSANLSPSVSITSPSDGAQFNDGDDVDIAAEATDPDGSIDRVEFYNGPTLLTTDSTAPYAYTWPGVTPGSYTIRAVAHDDTGKSAEATVDITVNDPTNQNPSVSLISPAGGASYAQGEDIVITATASDPDGTIDRVEFLAGATLLATDSAAPYEYTWSGAAAGEYAITAVAYDDGGASALDSASISVTPSGGWTGEALLVVANTNLGSGDSAARNRLQALGYNVTVVDDDVTTTADAASVDVVLVSSTCLSGSVGTKFRDVSTAVVIWETYIYDDMYMDDTETWGRDTPADSIEIADAGHALAAGLTGTAQVVSTSGWVRWGTPPAGATVVATLAGDASKATIFAYDVGDTLTTGTAAGRRVGLFLDDDSAADLTADGWALFDAAVAWASGASGGGGDTTPPAAPTGLGAGAATESDADLDWNDSPETDVVSYSIYLSTQSGFAPSAATLYSEGVPVSQMTVFGLDAATTYYFVVTAVDLAGNESAPSSQVFVTTQQHHDPFIEIEWPNGGEVLYVGTTVRITWDSYAVENMDVLYSIDGGSTWDRIGYSLAGDADWMHFAWTVPDVPSTECLITMGDYNWLIASDRSDDTFEIRAVVDLDGDGMDDTWETYWFGADDVADATSDYDGDGVGDYQEFMGGTDPTVADAGGGGGGSGSGCAAGTPSAWPLPGIVLALCILGRRRRRA